MVGLSVDNPLLLYTSFSTLAHHNTFLHSTSSPHLIPLSIKEVQGAGQCSVGYGVAFEIALEASGGPKPALGLNYLTGLL